MSLLDTHGTAVSTFRKHSLGGCYSNNLTEGSQTQVNDPTSHKSEFMHAFDFLFQTSRKDVTESAAAEADKAKSNFPFREDRRLSLLLLLVRRLFLPQIETGARL